mgnify:CR=1 FL=1
MKAPNIKPSILAGGGILLLAVVVGYALLPKAVEAPSETENTATSTVGGKMTTGKNTATGGGSSVGGGGTQAQPQQVLLITPNGGEIWQRGIQYQVKWTIAIDSKDVQVILIPSTSVIVNPFTVAVSRTVGQEMFNSTIFPTLSAEGSYTYKVPQTVKTGTYQVLIWAGYKCNTNQVKTGCAYDLSDKLFTIR